MKTKLHNEWYWHAFLLIAVFLMLWPIVFMLSTSLKDLNQVFESTLNPLPFPPTFDNYTTVLHNFPLLTYIWNTFYIAIVVIASKAATRAYWRPLPLCITTLNTRKQFSTVCC